MSRISHTTHRPVRLASGAATLAASASATAALAVPTHTVFDSPLVADATQTTALPYSYTFNIFGGEPSALPLNGVGKPTAAGTFVFGSMSSIDESSTGTGKTGFNPFVVTGPNSFESPFIRYGLSTDATGFPLLFGTDALINESAFEVPSDFDEGTITVLGPAYGIPDGPDSYNTWLEGPSAQFFLPFRIDMGETELETLTLGYLEFAYDAPSLSVALLAYGYEQFDSSVVNPSISTPEGFTPYTPPEDFVMTPIPEPSAVALGAALAAGSAALFRRRRPALAA